jgi:glutamate synthase (NADPH/NADH)
MGLPADFDDRQTQIESEAEAYHPYEYQTDNNGSWAGALPVKQYALPRLTEHSPRLRSC